MTIPFNFFVWMECRISCAVPTASWICLSCKKANCSAEMWLDKIGWRRLDMILYKQLHKEMGQKSLKEVGLSVLWMSAMKVEL